MRQHMMGFWDAVDHMQTICTSLQTDNHTNTSSLNFYRPDALPGAQPTTGPDLRGPRGPCPTKPSIFYLSLMIDAHETTT